MKLLVTKFSQRDPRWAQNKLGTSTSTIDLYGCALASLAMIEKYFQFDTDPGRLNQLLINKGVYAEKNLMQWWIVNKANEFVTLKDWIDCVTTAAPMAKVDAEIAAGRPCIAHVDLNPNQPGPDHFVVIFGKTEDGHYLCYDPWYLNEDAIFFDARYGDPAKGIFRLLFFNGPIPQPEVPKPSTSELEGQITQWKQHFEDIKDHLRPAGIMTGDDLPKVIGVIDGLIAKSNQFDEHLKQDEKEKEQNVVITDTSHDGYKFYDKWTIKNWMIEFWKKEVNKNE